MGHNIFLLDISHLTEMDMVSFIKGEIEIGRASCRERV